MVAFIWSSMIQGSFWYQTFFSTQNGLGVRGDYARARTHASYEDHIMAHKYGKETSKIFETRFLFFFSQSYTRKTLLEGMQTFESATGCHQTCARARTSYDT